MLRKIFKFIFYTGIVVGLIGTVVAGVVGMYFYFRFTRDLPQIESLKDYRPKAVTTIHAIDGTVIAEVFDEHGKRYPVEFRDVPQLVRNAFLAAEDANFYSHQGIDPISIIRALVKNLSQKKVKQGASTITQQTVKSLLLTREKSMERKVKEAILSYRLEKYLTKDEIFSIYLNEIYLGSGSNGVKAAAKVHFHKNLNELTIGEAAFLAGLPQQPSKLTDPKHRKAAIERQHYVLEQMEKNSMITHAQAEEARKQELTIYHQDEQTIFAAPYFSAHVINSVLPGIFEKIDKYTSAVNPGGYDVYTTVDLHATELGVKALQKGLREVDKRQGWRGPLGHIAELNQDEAKAKSPKDLNLPKKNEDKQQLSAGHLGTEHLLSERDVRPGEVYRAIVDKIGPEANKITVRVGALEGQVDLKKSDWAKRFVKGEQVSGVDPARLMRTGDVIEVSLVEVSEDQKVDEAKGKSSSKKETDTASGVHLLEFKLDQNPELEAAFMMASPLSGAVNVMVGGYDYQRSVFNRVTLARRQPGSSFKPFIYLAAVEQLGFTPSTIVPDSPVSLVAGDGKLWTPGNFDHKFLGPITLRTALQRSRNVVSVYLIQKLGLDRAIQSARKLGITTPIPPNLSISLGSAEIEMLEEVRAYGVFASGGWLADPLFVTQIKDRDGKIIYEQEPHGHRAIEEDTAFIMANMMKGVVERGTATVLKALNRPMAGKTGTTNDQMDAWFIGYTPEWVGGVWVGYDVKRTIGKLETGGKAAAPIMLYFMREFLKDAPVTDFPIADGVIPVPVNLESGRPVSGNDPGAFIEYFKSGTEPHAGDESPLSSEASSPQADDYLQNDEF